MAFNAGGTNVAGVQSIQQGVLKTADTTFSVTGTGVFEIDHTVPANKIWVLKSVRARTSTGTYTIASCQVALRSPAGVLATIVNSATTNITEMVGSHNFQLPAGWVVRSINNCTAHTITGNFGFSISYQEIDA